MELKKRKRNRLEEYDYSTPNVYFITACTEGRRNLFWANINKNIDAPENVPLTELGVIVRKSIEAIPIHYPAASVDRYVIMPNHIHLLLQIHSDDEGGALSAPTVSTIIRLMKAAVSKQTKQSVWQKGFYDHVIRNEEDYRETAIYIEGNPGKWVEDKLYICSE